jgi:hypothetical protein
MKAAAPATTNAAPSTTALVPRRPAPTPSPAPAPTPAARSAATTDAKGALDQLVGTAVGVARYLARAKVALPEVSLEQRQAATERFFTAVGLTRDTPVDPSLVDSILRRRFALDPTRGSAEDRQRTGWLRDRIERDLRQKGSLGDQIETVKKDLAERQIPLSKLLALGDTDFLTKADGVPQIAKEVAHHAYLLDSVTELAIRDQEFAATLRDHLYHQRDARGIDLARIRELSGTFGMVKTYTIDVMGLAVGRDIHQNPLFLPFNRLAFGEVGIPTNIFEAMLTGLAHGDYANAEAAFWLAVLRPKSATAPGKDLALRFHYDDPTPSTPAGVWGPDYNSWNLDFVLNGSGLQHPELLIAKLLWKGLLDSNPDEYIFRRALSLWITIQSYLFEMNEGLEPTHLNLDPEKSKALLAKWGEINREFVEPKKQSPVGARAQAQQAQQAPQAQLRAAGADDGGDADVFALMGFTTPDGNLDQEAVNTFVDRAAAMGLIDREKLNALLTESDSTDLGAFLAKNATGPAPAA